MIEAQVKGLQLTMSNLQKLERAGIRSMSRMVKGVTIQAGVSAAILSPPYPGTASKRIGKKKKKRPVVTFGAKGSRLLRSGGSSVSRNKTFAYVKANNQIIWTDKKIAPSKAKKAGLKMITKGMKYWDKKRNRWALAPINPLTKQPNRRAFRTGFKIPGYGAVKAGWRHAIRSTGKAGKEDTRTPDVRSNKLGTGQINDYHGQLLNRVKYASKISSSVPKVAEQKAWNWLLNNLWRTEKRKLEKIQL